MTPEQNIRADLLFSVQRALLGAVPPSLRAVTCGWEGTEITLRFVFDGEPTENEVDMAQIAGTEVIADFSVPWTINEEIVRLDAPASLRDSALPLWAYLRWEPSAA